MPAFSRVTLLGDAVVETRCPFLSPIVLRQEDVPKPPVEEEFERQHVQALQKAQLAASERKVGREK